MKKKKHYNLFPLLLLSLLTFSNCSKKSILVTKEVWGTVKDSSVLLYTLSNNNGMEVKITNYGGIITSIHVPDKNGKIEDVVLGYNNLTPYTKPNPYFGATVGRFSNRITNAIFSIDSIQHQLTDNNDGHNLHGGGEFNHVIWESEIVENEIGKGIKLHYISKDGTKGFPGNLDTYVTYVLTDQDAIHVTLEATTDKATHVSLTQHSYFNLNGAKDLIYDHIVDIEADKFLEYDTIEALPTGKILSLRNKNWDLKKPTRLGDNINKIPLNGYHHYYILNNEKKELKKVVSIIEPTSGRTLDVSTTNLGLTFYASNGLKNITGKYNIQYKPHIAFCIEPHGFPNAPNQESFPSTLLEPNHTYKEVIVYDFGIKK